MTYVLVAFFFAWFGWMAGHYTATKAFFRAMDKLSAFVAPQAEERDDA